MTIRSALYVGHVMHRRLRPRAHRLRYRIFSLLLDLDEVEGLAARLRFFSRNRFNLIAFHERDHGAGTDTPLRAQVEAQLAEAGMMPDGGAILLLTMPRILGFVFNPLSLYFCHDRGGRLRAIVYEVNNTFGERHSYVLPVTPEQAAGVIRQDCAKAFHVSPFLGMDLRYVFHVHPPDDALTVAITARDREGALVVAVHQAHRREWTDAALVGLFFSHPLITFKVVGGILWEAAKLWGKGVPVHHHPSSPDHPVSAIARAGEQSCI